MALPQPVTDANAPSDPPPSGCLPDFIGTFGIAIVNVSSSSSESLQKRQDDVGDKGTLYPVSQLDDGQVQAATTPVEVMTVAQVSQIGDGQVQGGMHTVTLKIMPTAAGAGAADGAKVTYMPAEHSCSTEVPVQPTPAAAGDVSAAPTATTLPPPTNQTSTPSNTTAPATDDSKDVALVSCLTNSTLTLTLSDSILSDSHGRTGYIASNYQFQFDNPPQSAALFTSGWSLCGDGRLALGGQTVFWQCLSGSFYNLYDRGWAAQCSEVEIRPAELVEC